MRKYLLTLFVILLTFSLPFHQIVLASKPFPEPIRGIYVNAPNTNKPLFNQLLSLVNKTDLNAMVIDIKDDQGYLTFIPSKNSPYYPVSRPYIKNPSSLMNTLKVNKIYSIARIVVFKDNVLANKNPSLSFRNTNGLWKNGRGDSFTNPFLKEVWDYNIGMAIEAVKLGFKEIQFDYVRFPEKFEKVENQLIYDKSAFQGNRVSAVSEFVRYAKEKLKPYNVKVSVDVFGNATVIPEASGIGQNFTKIAQNVDVISAMIYPSHWTSIFGIHKPDLQPYHLVEGYAKVENVRLRQITNPPISRPWLQDFTASWLGTGNYKVYGKKEVEDQIRALHAQGINEYLLWNATNNYTANVDYTPF
ncbi:putative glycoside hydrolase [Neobacillus sp. CF12]|uniref:putative glycoside hydrolase n=1 Tax=Neobacillus sp. CF12 TaxID=3055864 RepID=UPI0025A1B159|nr:putative glycoside hydrolase [Neobacillus sp. CF12]MDM5328421.1 putative glycoside hydrolase [Neobacillus sp. CF12]